MLLFFVWKIYMEKLYTSQASFLFRHCTVGSVGLLLHRNIYVFTSKYKVWTFRCLCTFTHFCVGYIHFKYECICAKYSMDYSCLKPLCVCISCYLKYNAVNAFPVPFHLTDCFLICLDKITVYIFVQVYLLW